MVLPTHKRALEVAVRVALCAAVAISVGVGDDPGVCLGLETRGAGVFVNVTSRMKLPPEIGERPSCRV